jgi:hypothetical protein
MAVIGDMGTGETRQYDVSRRMMEAHATFPFDFVIMLGDNIYGGSTPKDFERKFSIPYKSLLDAGVKFYGSLSHRAIHLDFLLCFAQVPLREMHVSVSGAQFLVAHELHQR